MDLWYLGKESKLAERSKNVSRNWRVLIKEFQKTHTSAQTTEREAKWRKMKALLRSIYAYVTYQKVYAFKMNLMRIKNA